MQTIIHPRRVPGSRSFRPWRTFASDDWSSGPVPEGIALVRAPGARPFEILLFGGGPATGYGVTTHELALAGHLGRGLAGKVGRGIDLQVAVGRDMTLAAACRQLRATDLSRYDAVVISVGVQDAINGASVKRWSSEFGSLVARTVGGAGFDGDVFLLGVPPLSRVTDPAPGVRDVLDRRALEMTEQLRLLAERTPRTHFVPFDPPPFDVVSGRHRTSETYKMWATLIAPHISRVLSATTANTGWVPQPGVLPAATMHGITDGPPDERFDRVVAAAHARFHAAATALSFMDNDRQWFKSVIGYDITSVPRGTTLCEWTVRGLTALAIPDTLADERFRQVPLVRNGAIRAYAGHPIVDRSGNPVGALCVIFGEPHDFTAQDLDTLRQLAGLVEGYLIGA